MMRNLNKVILAGYNYGPEILRYDPPLKQNILADRLDTTSVEMESLINS